MKTPVDTKHFLVIRYAKNEEHYLFIKTLRKRINNYFFENKISRHANGFMFFKIVFVLSIFVGSYALMISNRFSPLMDLLFGTICGLSTVLIVMNIGHDAAHNSLSASKKLNRIMSWSIELAGISHSLWKINHNIIHHPYPNVTPIDSEINIAVPFVRFSTALPKSKFHRYQHVYAPFIYLFFTLNLILVRDIQDSRIFPKACSQKVIMHFPFSHYIILFASKIFYFTYSLILPMLILNIIWWKILLGYLFVHAMMSIFELCIQLPLHINEHSPVRSIQEGLICNNWELQMLESTTDYLAKSKIANFITGGINTHTIHHFFPGICHIHYIALTKILSNTAKEFHLPYQCIPWGKGVVSHFKRIKQLAIEP
jgi:linoleoyl-CoA desaturase